MANQLLQMGSKGEKVKELQELLNAQGYSLQADGIYGDKTRSAVREYQKKNTLQVDGIVGDETWGSLLGKDKTPVQEAPGADQAEVPKTEEEKFAEMTTSQRLEKYEDAPPEYRADERLEEARRAYEELLTQRPAAFTGSYDEQIDQVLQSILNPEKFRYDPTRDGAWQAYREQYIQGARQASTDTMSQAVGLTGGYGNSYAQTAAAQTYQQYMTALAAKLPELQQVAYGRYQDEQQSLYDRAAMLMDLRKEEYERYLDGYEAWQDETEDAYGIYQDLYEADWERYQQARAQWEKDRSYYYNKEQDEAQAAAQAAKAASGGRSSGSSGTKIKRTLTFSNYLTRATSRYSAEGAQGLLQYLNVNRDAEGLEGLTDAEIELICRQFGYSNLSALRTAAKAQEDKEATRNVSGSGNGKEKESAKISVR